MRASGAQAKTHTGRRWATLLCTALTVSALAGLLLWPSARTGAQTLLNRVFAASEAVNSYVYDRFPVADSVSTALALCLLGVAGLCLTALCFLTRSSALPLLLAVALAGAQAYLGLSLPAAAQVASFGLLAAIVAAKRAGWRAALLMAGCLLAVSLATAAWMPGTNAGVEAASEKVRDWLSAAVENTLSDGGEQPPERMETRHENRRDLSEGAGSAWTGQAYRLVTVDEQQIARPHWVDFLRIAALCLLIPVALAVPFLPFVWLNSRQKKIAARYACVDDADNAAAVDGMFALVIGYLDACGVGDTAALHGNRMDGAENRLPQAYREKYQQCADIWREAVYSDHGVSRAQRDSVEALLNETETIFYDQADWKTRLRLKYVCCLHG